MPFSHQPRQSPKELPSFESPARSSFHVMSTPTPLHPVAWLSTVLLASAPVLGAAVLHGIGDLPGGIAFSEVRDAKRVDGTLYAVGGSSANPGSNGGDTAVLWTSAGGLVALPNLVVNNAAISFITASALTPDAAYIASRARSVAQGGRRAAVRVTQNGMVNLDLTGPGIVPGSSAAVALSDNGQILYGFGNDSTRAYRFSADGSAPVLIPFLNPAHTLNLPAARGCSADGSVMVGYSRGVVEYRAFRYVHGSGVSAIPLVPTGTWNEALGISPDGQITLIRGDSDRLPVGETVLHDARNGQLVRLGSPNEVWQPRNVGGLTADGAVVVHCYEATLPGAPAITYFRNAQGWFHLSSALAAGGVDLAAQDWDELIGAGISPDGTLVFGSGQHGNSVEGFVAEFPPGFLAGFGTAPTRPADPSIIGAWSSAYDRWVLVFLSDGTYLQMGRATDDERFDGGEDGWERGTYAWDPTTGDVQVVTQQDANGSIGLSFLNGLQGVRFRITGNTATVTIPGDTDEQLTRLVGTAGTLVGAWEIPSGTPGAGKQAVVFLPDGTYFQAQAGDPAAPLTESSPVNGMEMGTFTWDAATGAFRVQTVLDTNGGDGLSGLDATATARITGDGLGLVMADGDQSITASGVNQARLTVSGDASGLVLRWPAHLAGYSVQFTEDLARNVWAPETGTPMETDGYRQLTLPPPPTPRLYRLSTGP